MKKSFLRKNSQNCSSSKKKKNKEKEKKKKKKKKKKVVRFSFVLAHSLDSCEGGRGAAVFWTILLNIEV